MLFNSFAFILIFLPVVLAGSALLGRIGARRAAVGWLLSASLFYYGWWNPIYLLLIGGSVLANYAIGTWLRSAKRARRAGLWLGVSANLGLLGYYKYSGFFSGNLEALGIIESGLSASAIVLPLAISFFTFQQITYLVDSSRGAVTDTGLLDYALFVTFFPQLIAGPIVHHTEMMPQFARSDFRIRSADLSAGLTFFIIGLFKKVVIADGIAQWSTPLFDAALLGDSLGFADAWVAALGYSLQLYFDFSGYSDMAIGLARMFGIHLPWNFYSPYKATSAIEFWRRWHITLSRFLRDYVYITMGGNRRGPSRRYVNLFVTMLLGGLWHGAGWTFVLWGALHGFYLVANHGWRAVRVALHWEVRSSLATRFLARTSTFIAVVFAWVLFRAESLPASIRIWSAMLPFGPGSSAITETSTPWFAFVAIALALGVAWLAPNTQQWMARAPTGIDVYGHSNRTAQLVSRGRWKPSAPWAVAMATLAMVAFYRMMIAGYEEFLYRFF